VLGSCEYDDILGSIRGTDLSDQLNDHHSSGEGTCSV
jgi:hypothetical protein